MLAPFAVDAKTAAQSGMAGKNSHFTMTFDAADEAEVDERDEVTDDGESEPTDAESLGSEEDSASEDDDDMSDFIDDDDVSDDGAWVPSSGRLANKKRKVVE